MKLKRNKILITGGSKGIGKEMALRFLALGNQVIVTGRNTYALRSLQEAYPELIIYQCDLNKGEEIKGLVDFVRVDHPDLNILINNAGVQFNYDLSEKSIVMHWVYEELSTNLIAPINLITSLVGVLEKNENAAIVNVSSALAFVPKQSAPIYSASKAGLHNFTQVLRYQLEGRIKVFELIPPLVDTSMTNGRGSGKISPKELVSAFVKAFQQDQLEINVGKVKVLRWLHRLYPSGAERMMRFK